MDVERGGACMHKGNFIIKISYVALEIEIIIE
jgi:hypothetical protein